MKAEKFLGGLLCAALMLMLLPTAARAASFTVTDGQTFNFAAEGVAAGDIITVEPGATATLEGASGTTYTNVQINCGAGANLTLCNVNIDSSSSAAHTPLLTFTDSGNTLTLADGTTSNLTGAPVAQCVTVLSGTALEIYGPGALNVTSSTCTAIGGGGLGTTAGGAITINGGNIQARVLSSGFVCGAAIGDQASGGITDPSGCVININGGTVTATCDFYGTGIGGNGAAVNITGGTVYASGNSTHDIGNTHPNAYSGPDTTLSISGAAAVFLAHNSSVPPLTGTHRHLTYSATPTAAELFGFSPPGTWTPPYGAYLRVYTLSYDANGGNGAPSAVTQLFNTTTTVAEASGLSREGYTFDGWNMEADGGGTTVREGEAYTFTADKTLYAQWTRNASPSPSPSPSPSSSPSPSPFSGTNRTVVTAGATQLYVGGRTTLTPQVPGGEWTYDKSMVTLTQNADGSAEVKALKAGNTTLHYTVGWASADISLTISGTSLPRTGQNYMPVYLLFTLAGCAAAGTVIYRKKKPKSE